jgi:hypothetical protein
MADDKHAPSDAEPQPQPKRKRGRPPGGASTSSALTAQPVAAPSGLPALFERAASAADFNVDALTKLMALKREIEADGERRAFDSDFASLQAELSRVAASSYDPSKHRHYADINAVADAVGPACAAKGFALTFDTELRADGRFMKAPPSSSAMGRSA